jgi:hypothetical protein
MRFRSVCSFWTTPAVQLSAIPILSFGISLWFSPDLPLPGIPYCNTPCEALPEKASHKQRKASPIRRDVPSFYHDTASEKFFGSALLCKRCRRSSVSLAGWAE